MMGRGPDPKQYVQLIPASGWWAHYVDELSGEEFKEALVAWALTANGDVYPLECDRSGFVDEVLTSYVGFAGIHYDGDTGNTLVRAALDGAHEKLARLKEKAEKK